MISLKLLGSTRLPSIPALAWIILMGGVVLTSCDFRTLPSAIENVDATAYQVDPGSKGGGVVLRIPVPSDDQPYAEEYYRSEPPPGYSSGLWREELNLVPSPVWTSSQEYWLGWFWLHLLAIDRDSLPDPRSWRNSGIKALYNAGTHGKDPFTRYIPPVEGERIQGLLDGTTTTYDYGFLLRQGVEDSFVVGYTLPGGPAQEAGMRRDDRILDVDGMPYLEFLESLDAKSSSSSRFRIFRPTTGVQVTLTVTSRPLAYPSVWVDTLPGGIGYISISEFLSSSGNETEKLFATALHEMRSLRRNTKAWVLDLRDNGGGTILSSQGVAGSLLGGGVPLVRVRERTNRLPGSLQMKTLDTILYSPATSANLLPEGKLVFLQNRNTASASEILLSALREHLGPAQLVTYGDTSYGKGIGQVYIDSPLGGFFAVTLMTIDPVDSARYHGVGIAPDVRTPKDGILVRAMADIAGPMVAARGARIGQVDPMGVLDGWNRRELSTSSREPLKRFEGSGPLRIW